MAKEKIYYLSKKTGKLEEVPNAQINNLEYVNEIMINGMKATVTPNTFGKIVSIDDQGREYVNQRVSFGRKKKSVASNVYRAGIAAIAIVAALNANKLLSKEADKEQSKPLITTEQNNPVASNIDVNDANILANMFVQIDSCKIEHYNSVDGEHFTIDYTKLASLAIKNAANIDDFYLQASIRLNSIEKFDKQQFKIAFNLAYEKFIEKLESYQTSQVDTVITEYVDKEVKAELLRTNSEIIQDLLNKQIQIEKSDYYHQNLVNANTLGGKNRG